MKFEIDGDQNIEVLAAQVGSIVSSILNARFANGERKEAAVVFIGALNEHIDSPAALLPHPIQDGEFAEYDRQHPYQRAFTVLLRKAERTDPHMLARSAIEAVFDHLLNPKMLKSEPLTENKVDQAEAQLFALVNGMADQLRELIRRPRPDDVV